MKSSKDYLEEANAVVPRLTAEEAVARHGADGVVIVDVRDSGAVAQSGTVAGAQRIPRGMLEFIADAENPMHNQALTKDAEILIICAAGGQAALAGKTMLDMGYKNVSNIGGLNAWKEAGGPTEA